MAVTLEQILARMTPERRARVEAEAERLALEVAMDLEYGPERPCCTDHEWLSAGGCNAGCEEHCACSVPVNICRVCGDCDYGDNEEAAEIRALCKARRDW